MIDNPTTDMFGESPESPTFGTDPHKLHRRDAVSTSVKAAHAVDSPEKERWAYEIIEAFGGPGCIQDQVGRRWIALHPFIISFMNTVTARFKALAEKNLIYFTGETRPGESGKQQRVMVATKFRPVT